jgi:hypothetical protein
MWWKQEPDGVAVRIRLQNYKLDQSLKTTKTNSFNLSYELPSQLIQKFFGIRCVRVGAREGAGAASCYLMEEPEPELYQNYQ